MQAETYLNGTARITITLGKEPTAIKFHTNMNSLHAKIFVGVGGKNGAANFYEVA